jgi:hypothetical protein
MDQYWVQFNTASFMSGPVSLLPPTLALLNGRQSLLMKK